MLLRQFRRRRCCAWLVGSVFWLLVACGQPSATPPFPRGLVVTISAPPPSFETQVVSRRWRASDIFQYEVSLRRWDGAGFVALDPPLQLVLPQKGESKHEARFLNLRAGERYRVDVLAKGNVGGSAPERVLNSETPAAVEFDLRGGPDVEGERRERVSVMLDPVPFSGGVTLQLRNVPGFVQSFTVDLQEAVSGQTRYSGAFTYRQTMRLSNLRAGADYRVLLSAYRTNGRLYKTLQSGILRFDPAAMELEQERNLEFVF